MASRRRWRPCGSCASISTQAGLLLSGLRWKCMAGSLNEPPWEDQDLSGDLLQVWLGAWV